MSKKNGEVEILGEVVIEGRVFQVEAVDDGVSRFASICPRCGDFILFIGEDYWCENLDCDARSVENFEDLNMPE